MSERKGVEVGRVLLAALALAGCSPDARNQERSAEAMITEVERRVTSAPGTVEDLARGQIAEAERRMNVRPPTDAEIIARGAGHT